MIITMKMALIAGVAILAIAGITVGIVFATIGDDCIEFGAPVDLKFEQRGDKLFLLWGSPDNLGDCEAKYKVVLTINDEVADRVELNKEEYEIPGVAPCVKINVAVSTVDEDNKESEKTVKEITIDVGEVSEINVQNLKNETSSKGFTVSWEKPIQYDSCQIFYKISQDGEVKEEAYQSNSYEILTKNLHICENKIEVTPIIESKPGKSTEVIIVQDVGDVSSISVTELTHSFRETWWILEWKRPKNFEYCQIRYYVYINFATDHLETTEETIKIEDEILDKCMQNDLLVVPIIQNKEGKHTLIQITPVVNEVSAVTVGEITTLFEENLWTIKWERPKKYRACLITYQLYLGENPLEITGQDNIIISEEATFSNDPLKKCSDNEIGVLPTIENKPGLIKYTTVKGDAGEVSTVTVGTLKYQLNGVMWTLTWTKPVDYENCKIMYSVYVEDEQIQENVEGLSTIIANARFKKCQDNKVSVVPVIETKPGEKFTENIIGDVGYVEDITVGEITSSYEDNVWTVKWQRPPSFDHCTITYQVYMDDSGTIAEEPEINISNDLLTKCQDQDVSIMPVLEGKRGKFKVTTIKGHVSYEEVSEVSLGTIIPNLQNNIWRLEWKTPTGYERCLILYTIYLGEKIYAESFLIATTIDNNLLQKCTNNEIGIEPLISVFTGPKTIVNIIGDLGDVSKITVGEITSTIKDKLWTINWEAPQSYEGCSIIYQIYLNGNPQNQVSGLETTISNDLLKQCEENNIGIKPIIEGEEGEMKLVNIKGEPPIENRITQISFEIDSLDNVKLEWKKSDQYEKCDFMYKLEIKKGEIVMKELEDLTKEVYEGIVSGIENCEEVSASVIARYNIDGKPMIFTQCANVLQ